MPVRQRPTDYVGENELSRREALKAGAAGLALFFSLSHMTPAIADELERLAHGQLMTGERLAGILRTERARWNALLAQVGPDRLDVPGVEGMWSVKEIVAHLSWYEGRVIEGARQVLSTGTFTRSQEGWAALPMDERNARMAEAARARPAEQVLAEAEATFGQLLALIQQAPTDILNDPKRLSLPDDLVPWMAVANNSYAHYREHEAAIVAWLAREA
jgi:hypothetical protein